MDDDDLDDYQEIEDKDFNSLNLHAGIGYFIVAYSKVELGITTLLALLTKNEDFEAFHILTRGMDLRVKIERLQELCKPLSLIEPKSALDIRLELLDRKICQLRNKLSHSSIEIPSEMIPEIRLASISSLKPSKTPANAETLHLETLALYTEWCEAFFHDVLSLFSHVKKSAKFSISHPHSMVPKEFRLHLDQLARRARLDRLRRDQRSK